MRIEQYPAKELGPALATRVAEDLAAAIEANGRAHLAVPGGTTPACFLRALGRIELPWEKVTVTLTDERCVPADHPRSNQRALAETLFGGSAAAAAFIPLFDGPAEPSTTVARLESALAGALPLDVCVLGMGDDMHTASLFPGAPGLAAALDPRGRAPATVARPQGQSETRITLTAPVLSGAGRVYLLIKGADKRAALDGAFAETDPLRAPVMAVLSAAREPVVFYAD